MVSIKNIILKNGIISASCYMEDDKEKAFFLKIDTSDFSIQENSLGFINTYCRMAVNKLRKTFLENGSLPNELYSNWC